MNRILTIIFLLLICIPSAHSAQESLVLSKDTLWAGEVSLNSDVLVLPGATLTIEPGTVVRVTPNDSTMTEPQYLASTIEITVRGNLQALGTESHPIIFALANESDEFEWAGLYVDEGSASLSWCRVSGAESGLTVIQGDALVSDCLFSENRYGVSVVSPEAHVNIQRTTFEKNDYGLVLLNGAEAKQNENRFVANEQKDILKSEAAAYQPEKLEYSLEEQDKDAPYQSESLLGVVVWKDRVTVSGVVRIPQKTRLIIMPGTIVEFTKSDSNGDGIGENGLLVMGMLVAKGTEKEPIIFRSAEKDPQMADWDAINIYTSDGFQNILEYVQIEDAYRAVHIHFSNVLISHAVVRNNYRGLQFQESLVEVKKTDIYGNKNAMRARDSEIVFNNNRVYENYSGPNVFRATGTVQGNLFSGNLSDGLRVREGALDVEENSMIGNRYGLTVAYANFGVFGANVLSHNHESGAILKGTDNIKFGGNFVGGNGGNGISLLESRGVISDNQISGNGERGIGIISYRGVIENNNIIGNTLYGIGLDGENDIHAPNNWWGDDADIESLVYDRNDEPQLGRVDYEPPLEQPSPFIWPVADLFVDSTWDGDIVLQQKTTTHMGSTLKVSPGTKVQFGPLVSLWLFGRIEALGTSERRIVFRADDITAGQSYWDQITTEKNEAIFQYCDFHNGDMALHSHFSNVDVNHCRFSTNESGFRARGGPISVKNSYFTENVYGMVFYLAKGVVENNIFSGNEMGILVRAERRGGVVVQQNNIYDNSRYNIRMGDFNEGNSVNARNNWWGDGDPSAKIWDDLDEAGIGLVEYEPYQETAFQLKVQN